MTNSAPQGKSTEIIDLASARALEVALANTTAVGLRAASSAYPEVWARDAIITGLGLAAVGEKAGIDLLRRSLSSLAAGQSRLGRIPNHVQEIEGESGLELQADTVFAGAIDASLWYIIGHDILAQATNLNEKTQDNWESLLKAYRWLEYQDSNECGLLEVHESMDWADLFANRYNSLLPNVLWFGANQSMTRMTQSIGRDDGPYKERMDDIRFKINQLLWVGPEVKRDYTWVEQNRSEWAYPMRVMDTVLVTRPYYLPYVAFRDYGDRFDTFGNLLAIIFGLGSSTQTERILDYIVASGVDMPWPIKACWPVIHPGEKDWREYYRQYNLNLPHQYHNGGAWPFLGGFYIAALVKASRTEHSRDYLVKLAEMNRCSQTGKEWEFNEWFHGLSGQPMGHRHQSWSAGMFLYARAAVSQGRCPFFGEIGS